MARASAGTVLALLLAGCAVGTAGERLPLAGEPRGANLHLQTPTATIRGELLEVRDTGLLMLTNGKRLTVVPLDLIGRAGVESNLARTTWRGLRAPHTREALRKISRFPQGLTPQLEAALLAAYGQTQLDSIKP